METIRPEWKTISQIEDEKRIAAEKNELEVLKKRADEIDIKLIRSMRAKLSGTATDEDEAFYRCYESELNAIVTRIKELTQLLQE